MEWQALDTPSAKLLAAELGSWETVDAGPLLAEARMVKSPWEVEQLAAAVTATEQVIREVTSAIDETSCARSISKHFQECAFAHPDVDDIRLCVVSTGPMFTPFYIGSTEPAGSSTLIKLDVGVTVGMHGADIARTFSIGVPLDAAKRRFDALAKGHQWLRENVGPGLPIATAFDSAMEVVRKAGIEDYSRGHLGHSVGVGPAVEEYPVLGHVDQTFEEGMVFSLETPYYGFGIGSIQLEDMVVVTAAGNKNLNTLPHAIIQL